MNDVVTDPHGRVASRCSMQSARAPTEPPTTTCIHPSGAQKYPGQNTLKMAGASTDTKKALQDRATHKRMKTSS